MSNNIDARFRYEVDNVFGVKNQTTSMAGREFVSLIFTRVFHGAMEAYSLNMKSINFKQLIFSNLLTL